jgi:hypothetical protein
MSSKMQARARGARTRLAAIVSLTLLPIAAGIAGLATTDLALQTRAKPPTMGALEASSGGTPPVVTPPPVDPGDPRTVYISDLPFTTASNDWGPVERDRSNGEQAANDGGTITLNGVTYAKGLGVHAYSEVLVKLDGAYSQFITDIGLDDEVSTDGSVQFEVRGDGAVLYESGVMRPDTDTASVKLDVAGMQELVLVVKDAGDGNGKDHADWAGARLRIGPPAPTGLTVAKRTGAG